MTDSELHSLVTSEFTRLPCGEISDLLFGGFDCGKRWGVVAGKPYTLTPVP
jgi:hypothetical protein